MKVKSLVVLLIAAVALIVISTGTVNNSARSSARSATKTAKMSVSLTKPVRTAANPPGTTDGAKNPELIPTHAAYLMLFRLIANRQTETEKARIRDYFKQLGIGRGAKTCPQCPQKGLDDADSDVLIAAVEEFSRQVNDIDLQSQSIKERYHPADHPPLSSQDMEQMTGLNKKRDTLIANTISSLRKSLSSDGWAKLQFHINDKVKRNMKIHQGKGAPMS